MCLIVYLHLSFPWIDVGMCEALRHVALESQMHWVQRVHKLVSFRFAFCVAN